MATIVTAQNGTTTKTYTVIVTRTPGDLDHFTIIGYQTSVTAGVAFTSDVVVTAYDADNNVKTDYTGQVYFASTDGSATLPYTLASKYTFTAGDNGVHTFPGTGFTLKIAGSKTITLTDGTVSVTSSGITVSAATKSKLLWVTQPASSVAVGATWDSFAMEITDAYGNRTSDTDEVTITPTIKSRGATPPLGGTLTKAAVNGLAAFGDITRNTAGTITISASANDLTATPESNEVTVSSGTADYFKVTGTASMTAGGENTITITAYDQYNNVAAGYSGDKTLTFSGASSSADPVTSPTCSNKNSTDINFASDTVITFTDGVGTSTMKLYKVETAHIKAAQGSIETSDSDDLDVTVSAGFLSYVKVEDTAGGTGIEVTTHSMTADDTFTVYAAGYDAYGNYKNDESVTWTGTDICLDKLSPTSGTSTTFTPTAAGDGTIVIANYDSITGDTTGTITVIATYTVAYNGNGSTDGSVPVDSNTYQQGAEVTVLGNTGGLTRINDGGTSYRFTGWNTDLSGDEASNVGVTFIMGSEDEILYAQWTAYVLRDTGPAGGLIFYDNGSYTVATGTVPSWRYLEAAPSDQDYLGTYTVGWGCNGTEISGADGTAVGTGEQNTIDIEAGCTTAGTAADICANLILGDNSDWFLPSREELFLMYTNLKIEGVGGFESSDYRSSSENGATAAYFQDFNGGDKNSGGKTFGARVRAVRAF